MRLLFNLSVGSGRRIGAATTTSARKLKSEQNSTEHFFGEEIMEHPQGGVSAQSEWPSATGRAVDEVVEEIKAASGSTLLSSRCLGVDGDGLQQKVMVLQGRSSSGTPKIG